MHAATFDNVQHYFVLALIWPARQVFWGVLGVCPQLRVVAFFPVAENVIKSEMTQDPLVSSFLSTIYDTCLFF